MEEIAMEGIETKEMEGIKTENIENILNLAETAALLRITPSALRELARTKMLPGAKKIGGQWFFLESKMKTFSQAFNIKVVRPTISDFEF